MATTEDGDKGTLVCSFCGKSQHEVRKLIAGPTRLGAAELLQVARPVHCTKEL